MKCYTTVSWVCIVLLSLYTHNIPTHLKESTESEGTIIPSVRPQEPYTPIYLHEV